MKLSLLLCILTLVFLIQCRVEMERLEHMEQLESVVRKTYYVEALAFKLAQVNHILIRYKYTAPETKEHYGDFR